jgi:hypothetical protein
MRCTDTQLFVVPLTDENITKVNDLKNNFDIKNYIQVYQV